MIWLPVVVMLIFSAATVVVAVRSRRRLQEALSRLDDAQLKKFWLRPGLNGRQRGWIADEMRRRGLDA